MTATALIDNFFRHEYGRLVALLSCRVGVQNVEEIEDAVQAALISALENWTVTGQPDNPSAWLFRAAQNHLLGELRKSARHRRLLRQSDAIESGETIARDVFCDSEIRDDLLRMLFVCCDEAIPQESQMVLALKTLCGFDVREIAIRLFMSEANVYKRLGRARSRLREHSPNPNNFRRELNSGEYISRRPAVHQVLYLLFTEGYLSSDANIAIRRELCDEAVRLTTVLAEHPVGQVPETFALLALMHLHKARTAGRRDGDGGLLLLEEQDRSLWDRQQIQEGLRWLSLSADGEHFSRYHAEAGIAAEHCLASTFEATQWDRIAECYALLNQVVDSPIHKLNQAVAVAEWKGPAAGLAVLDGIEPPMWLAGSYQRLAILADLHRRCGNIKASQRYRIAAIESAPTAAIKALLKRRLQLDNPS